jgi:hypothetical protein
LSMVTSDLSLSIMGASAAACSAASSCACCDSSLRCTAGEGITRLQVYTGTELKSCTDLPSCTGAQELSLPPSCPRHPPLPGPAIDIIRCLSMMVQASPCGCSGPGASLQHPAPLLRASEVH